MDDDILTIKDVARLLRLGHTTTYAMVQQGRIPSFKVGGQWRFRQSDIQRWIDSKRAPTTILYVEDDADEAGLTMRQLEQHHIRNPVSWVTSGELAIAQLQSGADPRLMLLDLGLPGISGLEVLRYVRGDQRLAALPVVVLTASASELHESDSRALGVTAYINKPIDMGALLLAVAEVGLGWSLSAAC